MEYFELLDEDGNRLGQVKERKRYTLSYQESEIEDLKWMNIDELWEKVRQQAADFCIWKEELERLYEHLKNKEIRS